MSVWLRSETKVTVDIGEDLNPRDPPPFPVNFYSDLVYQYLNSCTTSEFTSHYSPSYHKDITSMFFCNLLHNSQKPETLSRSLNQRIDKNVVSLHNAILFNSFIRASWNLELEKFIQSKDTQIQEDEYVMFSLISGY